jgi:tetratricopeptide (TPR) repeat protein
MGLDERRSTAGLGSPAHPGDMESKLSEAELQLKLLQIRAARIEQGSARLGIALKLVLIFWVAALAIAAAALIWEGWNRRGVVIESFRVAPSLAAQGLTGDVIASKILGSFTNQRMSTDSMREPEDVREGWRSDYDVELANTGLTIDDARRMLRRWLGNDTRVTGELLQSGQDLILTVRSEGGDSRPFLRPVSEVDELAKDAAEHIYKTNAPFLYGTYLVRTGRADKAIEIFRDLAEADVSREERAWGHHGWAWALIWEKGQCEKALAILEHAIELNPKLPNPEMQRHYAYDCRGRDQEALDSSRRALVLIRMSDGHGLHQGRVEEAKRDLEEYLSAATGDFAAATMAAQPNEFTKKAVYQAFMHDIALSRETLSNFLSEVADTQKPQPFERALYWEARFFQAWQKEDWAAAVSRAREVYNASLKAGAIDRARYSSNFQPYHAVALARNRDMKSAKQLIRSVPDKCYSCARARALIATVERNPASADRHFRQATLWGPDLPFAYAEWGQAKLRRSDVAGAITLFNQAHRRAPNWADPLKYWGDGLARQGRYEEAIERYEAAFRRAPRWGALHLDWGDLLWRIGKRDQALKKLRAAARLDLSSTDLARLRKIFAGLN